MVFGNNDDRKIIYEDISFKKGKNDFPVSYKEELIQKETEILNKFKKILNPEIEKLIDGYSNGLVLSKQKYTPIHVDEVASILARFYEKVRKIVDWKDDNALRRGAVERILKRILFPKLTSFLGKDFNTDKIAETVTLELIRSGHLPNDEVPTEKISIVSKALYKYLIFMEYLSNYGSFEIKEKTNFANFVLEIAACEVEEILANPMKENGIILAMTEILNNRISIVPINSLTPDEKVKQIKVAVQRTLYDLDDNYVVYQILKENYPNWKNMSPDEINELAKKLPSMWKNIYKEINIPSTRKFTAVAEKVDTVFTLLDDVLEQVKDKPREIKSILEDKEKFKKLFKKSYNKRLKTLKTRLFRLAIFSTLSVFLSNWFTFFIVEIPLAHIFYEGFNLVAAIADFMIPTFVMFLLVVIIKPPKEENIKKVMSTALNFVYQDEGHVHYQIRTQEKRFNLFNLIMTVIYVLTTGLIFYGISYIFHIAQLPMTSVIFDTFTIALTVYAAVVIRNQSKELNVDEGRSAQDFVLDIITVPVAKVGSFLARKWKEYNVVAIFFNFIIETPLAVILDFIQGWSEYIKERRTELH